ncbi:MAG: hypothetical protein WDM91_17395 [Rhizomicrobium sp.]
MSRPFLRIAIPALVLLSLAAARAQVETVVVTASLREEAEAPHLSIVKRADHLITRVNVTCDTREAPQRLNELKETLRNMMRAASGSISLGVGDRIVGELNEANFDDIITPDVRPDTSRAIVIVKTKVAANDTLNAATRRLTDFIRGVPRAGRTQVLREGNWDLTIVGPEQYHDQLVALILADAKRSADALGPGYGVSIEGLERQVNWYQKGPLDLGLYIAYTLKIGPVGK